MAVGIIYSGSNYYFVKQFDISYKVYFPAF